jgi:hypothetical protein
VLEYLDGRLPVATPELLACGEYENGWRYVVSRGDPRLLGRLLAAYGRSFAPRELLAYTLLHRHSNLPECLAQLPAPPEPTLDCLALTWFGTA